MKCGLGLSAMLLALGIPAQLPAQTGAAPPPADAAVTPAGLVPAAELRSRPRFLSGADADGAPEVLAAAAKGGYGKVMAQAIVTPDGHLTDIVILTSSGVEAVDKAVIRTLGTWKLTPPIDKAGNKVATRAKFPFALGHFPTLVSGGEPEFPEAAKAAFHNGIVWVRGVIDRDGNVVDVKIIKSSKSQLLDTASVTALSARRYQKPLDFAGNPTSFDLTEHFKFSQAEAGGGSYLTGLKLYKCSTFIGETDWRAQANPGADPTDEEFNTFMGGLALIVPESLGWGNIGPAKVAARHEAAWRHALAACRTQPDSMFLEQYKKG